MNGNANEAVSLVLGFIMVGIIVFLLIGCDEDRTLIIRDIDSPYPAINICADPINQGTTLCP